MFDGSIHDGHTSHFEGVQAQNKPITSHYDRSIRLNKEPIVYPQRVRAYSPSQAICEAMERKEELC